MKTTMYDTIRRFISEMTGTGLLVFLGCMGCAHSAPPLNSYFQMCLNFGLVVLVLVQCFAGVSGCHINPTVTLAALIFESISLPMAIVYFIGQMTGSVIGYGLLKAITPHYITKPLNATHGLCVTIPHGDLHPVQAVAIEFMLTAALIAFCWAVWDSKNTFRDSIPISFGLAVGCLALTGVSPF